MEGTSSWQSNRASIKTFKLAIQRRPTPSHSRPIDSIFRRGIMSMFMSTIHTYIYTRVRTRRKDCLRGSRNVILKDLDIYIRDERHNMTDTSHSFLGSLIQRAKQSIYEFLHCTLGCNALSEEGSDVKNRFTYTVFGLCWWLFWTFCALTLKPSSSASSFRDSSLSCTVRAVLVQWFRIAFSVMYEKSPKSVPLDQWASSPPASNDRIGYMNILKVAKHVN